MPQFIVYSPTEGHLDTMQVLKIINEASQSIGVGFCVGINFQLIWISTKEHDCWGHMVKVFNCLIKKSLNSLPKEAYPSASPPAVNESSCAPHLHEHLVLSVLWISVILIGMQ